jgi:hypothetical protein
MCCDPESLIVHTLVKIASATQVAPPAIRGSADRFPRSPAPTPSPVFRSPRCDAAQKLVESGAIPASLTRPCRSGASLPGAKNRGPLMGSRTDPARGASSQRAHAAHRDSAARSPVALPTREIVEIMLNPDGRLWVDRLGRGASRIAASGCRAADGERIIRLGRASCRRRSASAAPARLGRAARDGGERFEGLLPPVVSAPTFAIRKPAVAVFTLDDYVAAGIMDAGQAEALRLAVAARKNILVAGGTSTGKTTLTNALLAEMAKTADRVVIIEDTRELAMRAPQPRRHADQGRRGDRSPISCAPRCACGPTASRSARCAGPKRSTC